MTTADHPADRRRFGPMGLETWRRHASGWSVWTRVVSTPPLLLAIWSHTWIGHWWLLALAAMVIWLWLNPRLFPPPRWFDAWAARATFGERLWLCRRDYPLPDHHVTAARWLSILAGVFYLPSLVTAWLNLLWPTLFFAGMGMLLKLWFVDRMAWLFDETRARDSRLDRWLIDGGGSPTST